MCVMYVCVYVCMYVCMCVVHACNVYVRMYVHVMIAMHARMYGMRVSVMYVCNVCLSAIYVFGFHACMYVRTRVVS